MKSHNSISKLLGGVGKLALLMVFGLLIVGALPQPARAAMGGKNTPNKYKSVSTADSHSIANDTQDDLQCRATDSSAIHCELKVGTASTTCASRVIKGDRTCNAHNYFYDPLISSRVGYDVFVAELDDSNRSFADNAKEFGYIVFPAAKDGDYTNFVVSTVYAKGGWGFGLNDEMAGDDTIIFKTDAPSGICSIRLNAEAAKTCKIGGQNKPNDPNARNGKTVTAAQQGDYVSSAGKGKKQKTDDGCGGGALDFILCPMQKAMMDVVTQLNTYLGNILDINTGAFQNKALKDASAKLLNIANAIYAIIFLVIIFANALSIGIDNYTFKKILPRLVSAIILSQFAFFLTGAFIEIGNILGRGVSATVLGFTSATATEPGGLSGAAFTAFAGVAIFLALLFLVIIIVALLILLVVLALRWAMLYVLILVAPLAFAAMVLPNTKKLFDLWQKNLIKLVMMYPIIMAITSISVFLGVVMSSSENPATIQLIGAMLPFIGFMMVPKAFKWSGGLMAATGGKLSEWGTKQAKNAGKEAWGKEGGYKDKLGAKGLPTSLGPITSMTSGRKRLESRGLAIDRAQKGAEAGASQAARIVGAMASGDPTGTPLEQQQHRDRQAKVAEMLKTLKTPEAQSKFVATMAKAGNRTDVETARSSGLMKDTTWESMVSSNFDSFDGMADMRTKPSEAAAKYPEHLQKLTAEGFVKGGAPSQKQWANDGAFQQMTVQQFALLGDQGVRSKINPGALSTLVNYKASLSASTTRTAEETAKLNSLNWLP